MSSISCVLAIAGSLSGEEILVVLEARLQLSVKRGTSREPEALNLETVTLGFKSSNQWHQLLIPALLLYGELVEIGTKLLFR